MITVHIEFQAILLLIYTSLLYEDYNMPGMAVLTSEFVNSKLQSSKGIR